MVGLVRSSNVMRQVARPLTFSSLRFLNSKRFTYSGLRSSNPNVGMLIVLITRPML